MNENTFDQIGDMTVQFIVMMRFAEEKQTGGKEATLRAMNIYNEINELASHVPISEAKMLEIRIRKHLMWIAAGPAAQA